MQRERWMMQWKRMNEQKRFVRGMKGVALEERNTPYDDKNMDRLKKVERRLYARSTF